MGAGGGLTRKIGIVAAGRAANTSSIIAVNVLVARAWTQAECGIFSAVWVLGNALIPIFLLGLPTSLLYFFPRRQNQRALVGQAALCLLASGVVLVGVLYLWGPELSGWLEDDSAQGGAIGLYLWPFLPYIFSLVAGGFADSALVASGRETWSAGLQLAMGMGLVAGAWAALYLGWAPTDVLALFSSLGMVRLLVAGWLVYRALGGGIGWWTRDRFGEMMEYTRPIGFNDAVGSLSRYVDRFVVMYFFAAGGIFAEYHFGAIEVPVSLLLAAVVAVLVPEISSLFQDGRLDDIHALWQRAVSRLALMVLPLAAFLLVFAEPLIGWMFPEYVRSVWVFRLYILVLPLRCAVYNPLLVGMGKARWALWGSLGDLGCNLALSLALVNYFLAARPEWAFLGPAVATVFSTYLQVVFLLAAIAWHLRWGLRRLLPCGQLVRVGVGACGAAVASRWLTVGLGGELLELAVGGWCFAVLMGVLIWTNPRDRAELAQTFAALTRTGR
ncbi:MAG: oligosaccharide flippase family protein [Candidatus Latescibacterota bacterium]|nr:oligosaccharide flippase family protein [Candidatus Latescibacterota bacterium]